MKKNMCKVCGYIYDNPIFYPWGEKGDIPSFDICVCCGVEFGYEDFTDEGIHQYRIEWIEKGAPFRKEKLKKKNWNYLEQLKNLDLE